MVRAYFAAILLFLQFSAATARAEVLFEGYSKITAGEAPIGYVVSRYEFDSKKKQFISTYFIKTGKGPSETTESLKAVADSELAPISYEYTSMAGKETKIIDAKFKAGTMTAMINNGKTTQKIDKKIPKGTFLSTFLVYLMLKSKEGLRSETKYEYQAIAEEDASITKGQALVGKEEIFNGYKAFKILNTFKDSKFLSYVNDHGEILGTNAMGQGIQTELVATAAEATTGQSYSATLLKTLFGSVPAGTQNAVSQARKIKSDEKAAPAPTKQQGVPQGQGVQMKADEKGN